MDYKGFAKSIIGLKNADLELRDHHILISTDVLHNSVIKSKPPLCFTNENAQTLVEAMDEVLEAHYESP